MRAEPPPPIASGARRLPPRSRSARCSSPDEVLAEEELRQLVLPALRADILVLEPYPRARELPLDCPISCFGGDEDRHVSRADLEAWADHTRGGFKVRTFPGRHFFIDT